MSWQLAILLATFIGIARRLYIRRYAQKSILPATIPPAVSYLLGVLPVGLIAGLVLFPHAIKWSGEMVILMAVLSVSMALANWFGFKTARHIAVAPQQTIGILTDVAIVVMGWTLLGERLTMWQFVGGGILLVAATLAIWAPVKTKLGDFERLKPQILATAIGAALLLAVGLVTEKALLEHMEIGGIFLVSWPVQTLGMLLLASKDTTRITLQKLRGKELLASTIIGLTNGLNGVFYIYAIYHSDNISLITVVGTIAFPLTILGAYLFLREREHHLIMWLSLVVALIGLLVIAL